MENNVISVYLGYGRSNNNKKKHKNLMPINYSHPAAAEQNSLLCLFDPILLGKEKADV